MNKTAPNINLTKRNKGTEMKPEGIKEKGGNKEKEKNGTKRKIRKMFKHHEPRTRKMKR